jgi:hypothetical protein
MRHWQTSSTESEGSDPRPATILSVPPPPDPMLISEAILHLQHVGVERIDRIANPYGTQTWKVTQNGEEYIYTADLEQVVWALEVSSDWEG